jgi:hypothetical protein
MLEETLVVCIVQYFPAPDEQAACCSPVGFVLPARVYLFILQKYVLMISSSVKRMTNLTKMLYGSFFS